MHQDHGNSPDGLRAAPSSWASRSVMMDGSLMEDGKTPASYDYNVRRHPARWWTWPTPSASRVEGELGCLGSLETGKGDEEDGHGAEGTLDHEPAADRPRPGRRLRAPRPASTPWPSPSAPATAPTSSPASPPATSWPSAASQEIHAAHPQHPPGDARLVHRCRRSWLDIIRTVRRRA
jgi:fructose-bisphosphate aldolase class II